MEGFEDWRYRVEKVGQQGDADDGGSGPAGLGVVHELIKPRSRL